MKKILISLLFMLFISGCSNNSIPKYIEKNMNLDVSSCKVIESNDTHGGFLGDGETIFKADCSSVKDEILSEIKTWNALPLSLNLDVIMYGGTLDGTTYGYNFGIKNGIPKIDNGYYYFIDRSDDAKDINSDKDIFRASFNFDLALYDIDTNTFYFYELDT